MTRNSINDLRYAMYVTECIEYAKSDPNDAAELLMLLAKYLRKGENIPSELACFMANAIEASMAKPKEHRLKALGLELLLTAENRRPIKLSPSVIPYLILFPGSTSDAQTISDLARE